MSAIETEVPDTSSTQRAVPLHLHTLDSLLIELVAGRAVPIGSPADGPGVLQFGGGTRGIVDWYRRHRDKWAKNVFKEDVEAIAAAVSANVPAPALTAPPASVGRRCFHLRQLRAHRFAGLHRFGNPVARGDAILQFGVNGTLTVVEGKNGSGKTSLLNAITWCLTGYVLRPIGEPAHGANPMQVTLADDDSLAREEDGDTPRQWSLASVTPLPDAAILQTYAADNVPLDTWVELTFEDEAHNTHVVTRRITRGRGGRIQETAPDLKPFGLDPIAFEIGTRIPREALHR